MSKVASMSVELNIDKSNIAGQVESAIKEANRIANNDTITFKFKGDRSEIDKAIKQLQGYVPNINTNLNLEFDTREVDHQLDALNKILTKKSENWGDNFKENISKSMKGIKAEDIAGGLDSDKIKQALKDITAEIKTFEKSGGIANASTFEDLQKYAENLEKIQILQKAANDNNIKVKIDASALKKLDIEAVQKKLMASGKDWQIDLSSIRKELEDLYQDIADVFKQKDVKVGITPDAKPDEFVSSVEKQLEGHEVKVDVTPNLDDLDSFIKSIEDKLKDQKIKIGIEADVDNPEEVTKKAQEKITKTDPNKVFKNNPWVRTGESISGTGYHGTKLKWNSESYDFSKAKPAQLGAGMYVTADADAVTNFGKGEIKQLEIDLEKVFVITKEYISNIELLYSIIGKAIPENVTPQQALNDLRQYSKASKENSDKVRSTMLNNGYQGMYVGDHLANARIPEELVVYDENKLNKLISFTNNEFQELKNAKPIEIKVTTPSGNEEDKPNDGNGDDNPITVKTKPDTSTFIEDIQAEVDGAEPVKVKVVPNTEGFVDKITEEVVGEKAKVGVTPVDKKDKIPVLSEGDTAPAIEQQSQQATKSIQELEEELQKLAFTYKNSFNDDAKYDFNFEKNYEIANKLESILNEIFSINPNYSIEEFISRTQTAFEKATASASDFEKILKEVRKGTNKWSYNKLLNNPDAFSKDLDSVADEYYAMKKSDNYDEKDLLNIEAKFTAMLSAQHKLFNENSDYCKGIFDQIQGNIKSTTSDLQDQFWEAMANGSNMSSKFDLEHIVKDRLGIKFGDVANYFEIEQLQELLSLLKDIEKIKSSISKESLISNQEQIVQQNSEIAKELEGRLRNTSLEDRESDPEWVENQYKYIAEYINKAEEAKAKIAELKNEVYELKTVTAEDIKKSFLQANQNPLLSEEQSSSTTENLERTEQQARETSEFVEQIGEAFRKEGDEADGAVGGENQKLTDLEQKVREVITAVNEKTAAFKQEEVDVSSVVSNEISDLGRLSTTLQEIAEQLLSVSEIVKTLPPIDVKTEIDTEKLLGDLNSKSLGDKLSDFSGLMDTFSQKLTEAFTINDGNLLSTIDKILSKSGDLMTLLKVLNKSENKINSAAKATGSKKDEYSLGGFSGDQLKYLQQGAEKQANEAIKDQKKAEKENQKLAEQMAVKRERSEIKRAEAEEKLNKQQVKAMNKALEDEYIAKQKAENEALEEGIRLINEQNKARQSSNDADLVARDKELVQLMDEQVSLLKQQAELRAKIIKGKANGNDTSVLEDELSSKRDQYKANTGKLNSGVYDDILTKEERRVALIKEAEQAEFKVKRAVTEVNDALSKQTKAQAEAAEKERQKEEKRQIEAQKKIKSQATNLSNAEEKAFTNSYYKKLFSSQTSNNATATFENQKHDSLWQGELVVAEYDKILEKTKDLVSAEKELDKVQKDFEKSPEIYANALQEAKDKISSIVGELRELNSGDFINGNADVLGVERLEKYNSELKELEKIENKRVATAKQTVEANKKQAATERNTRLTNDLKGYGKKEAEEYYKLLAKEKSGAKLSGSEQDKIDTLREKWRKATDALEEYRKIENSLDGNGQTALKKAATAFVANQSVVYGKDALKVADDAQKQLTKYDNNKRGLQYTDEYIRKVEQLRELLKQLNDNYDLDVVNESQLGDVEKLTQQIRELSNEVKNGSNNDNNIFDSERINKGIKDVYKTLKDNTAMSSNLKAEYKALAKEFENALQTQKPVAEVQKLENKLAELNAELYKSGRTGDSIFTTFGKRIKQMSTNFFAMYFSAYDLFRYGRQMVATVKEIDTALTELRKVSDATDVELANSFKVATQTAKDLGSTINDVINAQADWSRLGYNLKDSQELARISTLYVNVGDGVSMEDANQSLISTLKGFELNAEQAESVVDKFNEVNKICLLIQ